MILSIRLSACLAFVAAFSLPLDSAAELAWPSPPRETLHTIGMVLPPIPIATGPRWRKVYPADPAKPRPRPVDPQATGAIEPPLPLPGPRHRRVFPK